MPKRAKPGQEPSPSPRKRAKAARPAPPSEADVRRRAYELFERRGGEPGHDLDDWLQAEREISEHAE